MITREKLENEISSLHKRREEAISFSLKALGAIEMLTSLLNSEFSSSEKQDKHTEVPPNGWGT